MSSTFNPLNSCCSQIFHLCLCSPSSNSLSSCLPLFVPPLSSTLLLPLLGQFPFVSFPSLSLSPFLYSDSVLFPSLSWWLFLYHPIPLLFLFPFLIPEYDRSMTHNWRTWRPLRACQTFVIPSNSTGARLRRRQRTPPSLGNLRYGIYSVT